MPQAAERRLSYDKNLLREAEVAMKEQFQLRPNRSGIASSSHASLAQPRPPTSNDHVRYSEMATPSGTVLPFWRTTRGMLLIAAVVLVIISAIVLGAAAGTVLHKPQSITNGATIRPSTARTIPFANTGDSNPLGGTSSHGSGSIATAVSSLLSPPTVIVRGIAVETNFVGGRLGATRRG